MERLLIFLAVLIVVAVGAIVLRAAARARLAPLRMDSEFQDEDTDLIIGPARGKAGSPIDRAAQTLDATPPLVGGAGDQRGSPAERRLPGSSR